MKLLFDNIGEIYQLLKAPQYEFQQEQEIEELEEQEVIETAIEKSTGVFSPVLLQPPLRAAGGYLKSTPHRYEGNIWIQSSSPLTPFNSQLVEKLKTGFKNKGLAFISHEETLPKGYLYSADQGGAITHPTPRYLISPRSPDNNSESDYIILGFGNHGTQSRVVPDERELFGGEMGEIQGIINHIISWSYELTGVSPARGSLSLTLPL